GVATRGFSAIAPADRPPILVLFPYEGQFDPALPAKNAVLRLADFNTLARLANARVRPQQSVRAISCVHHVARTTAGRALVDTELEIVASGQGPFTWQVPVSDAIDIEVRLDSEEVSLPIAPGGKLGALTISRSGNHVLQIRRFFAVSTEPGFESLIFRVNSLPTARVVVDPSADGATAPAVRALGAAHVQADGMLAALLGPTDRVELRWPAPRSAELKQTAPALEGLVLWDITPS